MINQKGQAFIEVLIAGSLSLLAVSYIYICALKIIQTTLDEDKTEEQYLCKIMKKNDCL